MLGGATDAASTMTAGWALPPLSLAGKLDLKITLSAEGPPPSQKLKLIANQPIFVERVEYMLSNETCIAGEDVSLEGETVETPINDSLFLKVWNTPRPDRNHSDHSGPAKIGVTISANGKSRQFILPVQMEFLMQGNTAYRKIIGSKTFHGG
jgi:hypothetical protein